MKHQRKPLSKLLLDEIKAAETEKDKIEIVKKEEDQVMTTEAETEDKSKTKDVKKTEGRDWKRNGMFSTIFEITN